MCIKFLLAICELQKKKTKKTPRLDNRPCSLFFSSSITSRKYTYTKEKFQQMLNTGSIQTSERPYSSPLPLVPKSKSDSFDASMNFRRLNASTTAHRYPFPHYHDFTSGLQGMTITARWEKCS